MAEGSGGRVNGKGGMRSRKPKTGSQESRVESREKTSTCADKASDSGKLEQTGQAGSIEVHDAQEKRRERNFWRLCQQIGG